MLNKKALHTRGQNYTPPEIANGLTKHIMHKHGKEIELQRLQSANPSVVPHITPEESFSGSVGTKVVGGKAYWKKCFRDLMACAVEWGVPQYFVTFTANEFGWEDLRAACGTGTHPYNSPIEATRHYEHRWKEFLGTYLKKGPSALGTIENVWYRHEDQNRGSLHVHAAIWVEVGTEKDDAIVGTVPRMSDEEYGALSAASKTSFDAWRAFIKKVQMHSCRPKCFTKGGEPITECRYGYPRTIYDPPEKRTTFNTEADRYEYSCEAEEDVRISPYVPIWTLAWGAGSNIQRCSGATFLGYISKYITKPEPYGSVADTDELRAREKEGSPVVRFLTARIVGAPEAVFR